LAKGKKGRCYKQKAGKPGMKRNDRFSYENLAGLRKAIQERNLEIPSIEDLQSLEEALDADGIRAPNRLCINPLEGCDGEADGAPGNLTCRRYRRFASGGAGMIWVEATAVVREGRANPRQLWINDQSAAGFKELAGLIKTTALEHSYSHQRPFTVIQLTHSGRQSNPEGITAPIITHHSDVLDTKDHLPSNYPIISDKELDALQEKYVLAAKIAYDCGFDGVDIKACHGYLIHELLYSYTRKNSKYGGTFENRTRFLRDVVSKIRREIPDLIVTTRLNIYDGIPYPWGWGMKPDGTLVPDLTEPVSLINILHDAGVDMISIAVGNPYYNPHVERPYDYPIAGGYVPEEHPLNTIARITALTADLQKQVTEIQLVATGLSWLRQFSPNVGAAMLEKGYINLVGIGRLALAHPSFANELARTGNLTPEKLCITCSFCTQIMKDGGQTGCVTRDHEVYGPIYRAGRAGALRETKKK